MDLNRSKDNFYLIEPERSYRAESERQIAAAGVKPRSDSVRVVEALFTASPEFFQGKKPDEIRAFFREAMDFLSTYQAKETIISAVVHMDEKTPHMHLSFVPLTADGRLCAKEIVGNKKKLTWWQDEFWKHMVKKYPELERGQSASETGRDHIPPRIFKEMTRLDKQRKKLEELLAGATTFNAKSRIEAIQAILEKYVPNVERMKNQLKKYSGAFTDTAAENKRLKAEVAALKGDKAELEKQLKAATTESIQKKLRTGKLQKDYEKAGSILSRIPPEVLRYYTASTRPEPGKSTPNRTRKGEALE